MLAISLLEETHAGGDITWLLWVALGFFAVMVLVGWLSSRNQKAEVEPEQQPHEQHTDHK